jgi:hypothetical protein
LAHHQNQAFDWEHHQNWLQLGLIGSGWAQSQLIGPNPDWLGPIGPDWEYPRFWRAPDSIKLKEIVARKSAKLPFPKFLWSVPELSLELRITTICHGGKFTNADTGPPGSLFPLVKVISMGTSAPEVSN